ALGRFRYAGLVTYAHGVLTRLRVAEDADFGLATERLHGFVVEAIGFVDVLDAEAWRVARDGRPGCRAFVRLRTANAFPREPLVQCVLRAHVAHQRVALDCSGRLAGRRSLARHRAFAAGCIDRVAPRAARLLLLHRRLRALLDLCPLVCALVHRL